MLDIYGLLSFRSPSRLTTLRRPKFPVETYIEGKYLADASDVAEAAVRDWLKPRGKKPPLAIATINRRLAALRRILSLAFRAMELVDITTYRHASHCSRVRHSGKPGSPTRNQYGFAAHAGQGSSALLSPCWYAPACESANFCALAPKTAGTAPSSWTPAPKLASPGLCQSSPRDPLPAILPPDNKILRRLAQRIRPGQATSRPTPHSHARPAPHCRLPACRVRREPARHSGVVRPHQPRHDHPIHPHRARTP